MGWKMRRRTDIKSAMNLFVKRKKKENGNMERNATSLSVKLFSVLDNAIFTI